MNEEKEKKWVGFEGVGFGTGPSYWSGMFVIEPFGNRHAMALPAMYNACPPIALHSCRAFRKPGGSGKLQMIICGNHIGGLPCQPGGGVGAQQCPGGGSIGSIAITGITARTVSASTASPISGIARLIRTWPLDRG